MKFSGQGPNLWNALNGGTDESGKLYEIFNDMAADWPWPEDSELVPKVGASCSSCGSTFVATEMVYFTMENSSWVCWRHIAGLTGPVRMEPES